MLCNAKLQNFIYVDKAIDKSEDLKFRPILLILHPDIFYFEWFCTYSVNTKSRIGEIVKMKKQLSQNPN